MGSHKWLTFAHTDVHVPAGRSESSQGTTGDGLGHVGTARGVQGRAMVKTVPAAAPPPARAWSFGCRRRGTPGSKHSPVRGVDRPACDVQACSWPAQGTKHYGAIPAPLVVTQCANMVLRTPIYAKWLNVGGTGSERALVQGHGPAGCPSNSAACWIVRLGVSV